MASRMSASDCWMMWFLQGFEALAAAAANLSKEKQISSGRDDFQWFVAHEPPRWDWYVKNGAFSSHQSYPFWPVGSGRWGRVPPAESAGLAQRQTWPWRWSKGMRARQEASVSENGWWGLWESIWIYLRPASVLSGLGWSDLPPWKWLLALLAARCNCHPSRRIPISRHRIRNCFKEVDQAL